MCFDVLLLGFILPGILCFLNLVGYFLSDVREVFNYYFLGPFSLFSFWDPYNVTLVWLICPRGLLGYLRFLILFSIFCSATVISTILSSRSLSYSSASVILLLIPSSYCSSLFFSSSSSLVNISCNFSIFASVFFFFSPPKILNHLYYYYSEFFFSGNLHISTLFINLPPPGFYFVPLSGMKPSAFSSWLTCC